MRELLNLSACQPCHVVPSTKCGTHSVTSSISTPNMLPCVSLQCSQKLSQSAMTVVSTHVFAIRKNTSTTKGVDSVVNHVQSTESPSTNFPTSHLFHAFRVISRVKQRSKHYFTVITMGMFLVVLVMSSIASTTMACLTRRLSWMGMSRTTAISATQPILPFRSVPTATCSSNAEGMVHPQLSLLSKYTTFRQQSVHISPI